MAVKKRETLFKILPYAITGLISVAVILVIYAVNGIYPFGTGSVVCDDMVQQTISNYTYFWDYLHSGFEKSLLLNWETAAGAQVLTTGFYILKPWEIIFTFLCPRDGIVNGIPFLIIFKITMAALSMVFFLRKEFKIPSYWQIVLSVAYAFSAFILVYYTNMGWIDAAFMFPFLIATLLHMFRTGKWMPYTLVLTYTLLLSIYISYMVFMFLLFVGFLYLAFIQPKDTRKMAIVRFGVTSVSALVASAVINVPTVFYMFQSTRYEIKSEETTLDSILKIFLTDTTYSTQKLTVVLLVTSIFLAFLVILWVNGKKHKKACAFFSLSVLMLVLPVFFENINLIWHLGSYVQFPLRYLYMLIFMLVCVAAFVLQNMQDFLFSIKGKNIVALIIPAVACAAGGIYLLVTKVYEQVSSVSGLKYSKLVIDDCDKWMFIAFVLLAVFYVLCMFIGSKKLSYVMIAGVLLAEIGLLANVSFGTNSDTSERSSMYNLNFVSDSLEMAVDLQLENDNLSRIKDADIRLNSNYPLFFEYPALSNFTHLVSSDMTATMESLGYSQIYTRVLDSVGTLLSDALLNIKYTFSERELDGYEYTYLYDIGDSHLYSNNMTLPVGLLVNQEFMDIDIVENNNVFATNNQLYKALTGKNDKLCTTEEFSFDCSKDFETTVSVEGTKHVYLHIDIENSVANRGAAMVLINGKKVDLTYLGDDTNYNYPNNFHNELIDLGVRTDEDIEIAIYALKNVGSDIKVTVGYFDYTKLNDLCEINKNNNADVTTGPKSLTATVKVDKDDTYVFIPVTYDRGWTCEVNGEEADIEIAMSSFMAVKLSEGENVVEFRYLPYGMKAGAIITIIAALFIIAMYIIEKKKPFANDASNTFLKVFEKIYFAGMLAASAIAYAIPVCITIVSNIIK
ncbi:MAG: YfhO family protein [Clostridia bacterium]|nr:YfhO family protein [Clostridia bacterium]